MPLILDGSEQWFGERERIGLEQRIQVRRLLYEGRSNYQTIQVLDTAPFGRALVLDGALQTTETDEFIYHEMIVHPALISLAQPERVLIIGGGDGGCLRRALHHPLREVVHVELDPAVVEVCRRYLPQVSSGAFDDPRLRLVFADGYQFVEEERDPFDAVIIDLTDPFPSGVSLRLFTTEFYQAVRRILKERGLVVTQSSSPLLLTGELLTIYANLKAVFPIVRVYLAPVPSYPGVLWSFTLASVSNDPLAFTEATVRERLDARGIAPRYYGPQVHFASFALPPFLAELLAEPERFQEFKPIQPVAQ
ncbi:MAG: polyamine aminopropyltransferase [Dehalococcoidia bacterium]